MTKDVLWPWSFPEMPDEQREELLDTLHTNTKRNAAKTKKREQLTQDQAHLLLNAKDSPDGNKPR